MRMYNDPGKIKPVSTTESEADPFQTIPEQLQARKSEAVSQNIMNLRNCFNDAIATVKVAMPGRDASQQGRLRYERNYQRMLEAAKQLILATGQKLEVPAYLPPPSRQDSTSVLDASSFPPDVHANDDSHIRARKEKERAANIRRGVPGSGADTAWLNLQGEVTK